MGAIVESVKTINSAVRTLLLALLLTVLGVSSYYGYSEYTKRDRLVKEQEEQIQQAAQQLANLQGQLETKNAEVVQLGKDLREKLKQIDKLETSMLLLKTDQRLAHLRVVSIQRNDQGKATSTRLEFVEFSPQGDPLSAPKRFELPGDLIYVDNWIVKFDDRYIEKGDIQRGTSLCLFRRIFSEQQQPAEGISLDEIGMRPQAYAKGGAMSEFEQRLWSDFWEFANDPTKAAQMGIRAANGEAVSIKVREGKTYNILLRSSGGLSIEPLPDPIANGE